MLVAGACSKTIANKRIDLAGKQQELNGVDAWGKPLLKMSAVLKKNDRARIIHLGIDFYSKKKSL
jgi:hypothetical protein